MTVPVPKSTRAVPTITVEVWSDVVCPWCYIGKRRFAIGLAHAREVLAARGVSVDFEVTYRPYQLDPAALPGVAESVVDAYTKKFGGREVAERMISDLSDVAASVGLNFQLDLARRSNTLLAHRILWLSAQPESPVMQSQMKERLLSAYFTEGIHIGAATELVECAVDAGFGRRQITEFLASDDGVAEVAAELAHAAEIGITSIPTFVVNGQWSLSGAQESSTFVDVLTKLALEEVALAEADS